MTKQQSSGGNKQSTEDEAKKTPGPQQAKSGKEAASHSKAGSIKGAGGGAKQERKH